MIGTRTKTVVILACSIFFILLTYSCRRKVPNVDIDRVQIYRFDSVVATIDKSDLRSSLEKSCDGYGIFIDGDLNDTNYLKKMRLFLDDTLNVKLIKDVNRKYKSLSDLENEIEKMFKYIKSYFPNFEQPIVYTYISGVAVTNPILYNGKYLIIGIDCFLGADYYLYRRMGIPDYVCSRLEADNITKRAAETIIGSLIEPTPNNATVLDVMLYYGKISYLMQLVMPDKKDYEIIDYTEEQNKWCLMNEGKIWFTTVENNILFSKDYKIIRDHVLEAPFTKTLTQGSPGRVGQWVGFQIISRYAKNSDCTVQELIDEKDASKILSISKYKPKI